MVVFPEVSGRGGSGSGIVAAGSCSSLELGPFPFRAFPVPTQPLGQPTMCWGVLMCRYFKHLIGLEDPALHLPRHIPAINLPRQGRYLGL